MKIVTNSEMRRLEQMAGELGLPAPALMENAGRAFVDALADRWRLAGLRVVVLCGPGNNGGDGLVAARHLAEHGAKVSVFQVGRPPSNDAKIMLLVERRVPIRRLEEGIAPLSAWLETADLLVDALLGTGRRRPIVGLMAEVLAMVGGSRRRGLKISAMDLPSGLAADTGEIDPATLPTDVTVTLGAPKRGLFLPPGGALVGEIVVVDIGIPSSLTDPLSLDLIDRALIRTLVPSRPAAGHKGTFGRLFVAGGSSRYFGAPWLSAMAAIRVGAGLVGLAVPAPSVPTLASRSPEPIYAPLPHSDGELDEPAANRLIEELEGATALVVGPGLGTSRSSMSFLLKLLEHLRATDESPKVLIDADGLNLLSEIDEWWKLIPPNAVLTPHPGEMARLTRRPTIPDRIEAALEWASLFGGVLVLKGAHTVVATGQMAAVSPIATPALATAGTGDVLAGAIGGLIAQGANPYDAARAGVYIHGMAGRNLEESMGPAGAIAGDLLAELPFVLKNMLG